MLHLYGMTELMDEDTSELGRIAKFVDIDAFSLGVIDIFSFAKFFSSCPTSCIVDIDIEF